MDIEYSENGLFGLTASDIHEEAVRLYDAFFEHQTPLKAFRLAIVLYHLLEWIESENKPPENNLSKLSKELQESTQFQVLRSLANNSKHHTLKKSSSYEKGIIIGFQAGRSVGGECVGQPNLAVNFQGQEVWLREVFGWILKKYTYYFNSVGMYEAVQIAVRDGENL
ncbi:hypothetical protein [Saccharospirillum sp.]|uniref:hypothetical protein n=1 Tax=Saccharospirillum sp. TaxID=2033801 RepID=UPI0034A04BCC